jgi:hypothetical protein
MPSLLHCVLLLLLLSQIIMTLDLGSEWRMMRRPATPRRRYSRQAPAAFLVRDDCVACTVKKLKLGVMKLK